jgi:hypothetical protein
MDRPEPRPLSPFEKFVSANAKVPKAEADEVARREAADAKRGPKRGPKPKNKPAA